jgi:hypothetical protein
VSLVVTAVAVVDRRAVLPMLILVRHGRTEANASGLLLGRLDPELDEVGRGQAAAAAASLAGTRVARVITSPLARTRATAEQIALVAGVPVEVDDRWIELDYGELDGTPLGDVPAEVWAQWRADAAFAPAGGESLVGLGVREPARAGEARPTSTSWSCPSPIKAAIVWALVGDDITWHVPGTASSPASRSATGVRRCTASTTCRTWSGPERVPDRARSTTDPGSRARTFAAHRRTRGTPSNRWRTMRGGSSGRPHGVTAAGVGVERPPGSGSANDL